MASPLRLEKGMTFVELVVVLAVVFVLAWLSIPNVGVGPVKSHLIQCMDNARQIHMAAMSMATDGAAIANPGLAWPGDLKANGRIVTLSDYVNLLVRNDYLKPGDLKVFSAAGIAAYPGGTLTSGSNGVLVPSFEEKYNAFKVFLVKDKDAPETVFLATKNYTYNAPLKQLKISKSITQEGFVVIRKAGDASILKKQQAQNLPIIGKLPGGGTVESAENCLNPGPPAP